MARRTLDWAKTAAHPMRGLLLGRPTFQSEGKCMIAGNFLAFATEGIFDPHARVYADGGCDLSGRPLPCESSADVSDDVALVTAVLQKDRKATADFVNTYTDAVYSFIHRRLSPRHDLVDDLVQEVFIAAWENLGSFRGTSPLRAWLLGIARHKIEDYYRRLLQSAQTLDAAVAEELPATELNIEEIADRKRTQDRARQVLGQLPEHYSAALRWRYWEKRSAREMAEATGRTEKAIERLLARAREQFRRRWLA
jgi:RNA polymerase sigma-70 factor (ECF subfamily)